MGDTQTILVIFGITGDLAQRKLLPALRTITRAGLMPPTQIIGISRRSISPEELLPVGDSEEPALTQLRDMLSVVTMNVAEQADYEVLAKELQARSMPQGTTTIILYLSVPPQASLPIAESLGRAGINDPKTVKLLLEKPFGVDLASAQESVDRIAVYFEEKQLYRIDHYLAKEMAQNIIAFRSHNPLFRHAWNGTSIERIDIIAAEKIGIEGRASFYEQTGALRDFLQNHMMQLLALTLMDVDDLRDPSAMPTRRLEALSAIKTIPPDTYATAVRRGQYAGYADEVGNPGSTTETFVSLTLYSDDPRWQNVPIRLSTGKHFAESCTEIRITFRPQAAQEVNTLTLQVQPKEGFEMDLWVKKPGYVKDLEKASLQFNYRQQEGQPVEAYERVLLDAFNDDKSLFTSAAEVLASWRLLQPVQEYWAMHPDDLVMYRPGIPIEDVLQ